MILSNDMFYRDYLKFWMENYSVPNNRDTTTKSYQYTIAKRINPALGSHKLNELSAANRISRLLLTACFPLRGGPLSVL